MRLLVTSFALLVLGSATVDAQYLAPDTLPTSLVGRWEGRAAIDSGAVATGIPVLLTIARDGSVTGTVGHAALRNGRMERNDAVFARLFGLGTRWMIEGDLEGPLRAEPPLVRRRTGMPLDEVDGDLRGDLNATGGGKALSVQVHLVRQP